MRPSSVIDTPLRPAYIFVWHWFQRMSSTPFGDHLKREREMRGVSLEEISAATRISTRFLEAIEHEQWDQLPGGVFNRGFIRAMARFLGLDEDDMVAEYALETRDRVDVGVVPDPPLETSRRWGPAIAALVVLAAILASGWVVYARYGGRIVSRLHLRSAFSAAPAPAKTSKPSNAGGSTAAAPAQSAPAQDSSGRVNAPAAASEGSRTPAEAAPIAAEKLELKMEAGKPANVKVAADGNSIFEGRIEPGGVKQFEARDSLEIYSSDSSALFLELNGQTVPPIGLPGEPGFLTLTRKDLKPAAGGPH
jgi:cytoskeleton protein RodZ